MKRLIIALTLLLTSCAVIPQTSSVAPSIHDAPEPPVVTNYCNATSGCNYRAYADDLNWYMIYIFTYTKAVNEYAMSKGWKPPTSPPICRLVKWPNPEKFPDFSPSKIDISKHGFEWELTRYIKRLRKLYTEHIVEVHDASALQKKLCTY